MVCGAVLLGMFLVGCDSKQESSGRTSNEKEIVAMNTETEKEVNQAMDVTESVADALKAAESTEEVQSSETATEVIASDTESKATDSTEEKENQEKNEFEVPMLVGLSQEEAMGKLESCELIVEAVSYAYSDKVESGKVIDQSIPAGTMVESESNISLSISKGSMSIIMPDVVGMTVKGARALLEADGFKVYVDKQPEDAIVTSQNYAAGDSVQKGTVITIK